VGATGTTRCSVNRAASGGPPAPEGHRVPVCRCHGLTATYSEWWLLLHRPQAAIVAERVGRCDEPSCRVVIEVGEDVWLTPAPQRPETAASHPARPRLVCTPCRVRLRPHEPIRMGHARHTASAVLAAWDLLPAAMESALSRGEQSGATLATRRHTA
jgi:hypothetical protein